MFNLAAVPEPISLILTVLAAVYFLTLPIRIGFWGCLPIVSTEFTYRRCSE